ncbi:MAG TPA: hypothetical protein VNB23_00205 [Ramlibacter sp.]|nr:hypothetical protein [Ramlibacter sp.]
MNAPRRPRFLWLLLTAMVLWQMLGFVHGTSHPDSLRMLPTEMHFDGETATEPSTAGTSVLDRLFGGHDEGSGDCRLLDHLSHADPVPGVVGVEFPPLRVTGVVSRLSCVFAARKSSPFSARGPPSFS